MKWIILNERDCIFVMINAHMWGIEGRVCTWFVLPGKWRLLGSKCMKKNEWMNIYYHIGVLLA